MKSKIIRYSIIIACVVLILVALLKIFTPKKKLDTYLAIGDYMSVSGKFKGEDVVSFTSLLGEYFIEQKMVSNVNANYTSSGIDSSLLLEMITKDAYSGKDVGLVSQIKNSKYITISVGINDILQYVRFDSINKKVLFDEDVVERKLEIMQQNYYEIIDEIQDLNDEASIYLIGYYCPFEWVKDDELLVFNLLNDSIRNIGEETNVNYVDIKDVGKKENLINSNQIYLNNLGHEDVFCAIRDSFFVYN